MRAETSYKIHKLVSFNAIVKLDEVETNFILGLLSILSLKHFIIAQNIIVIVCI